MQAEPVLVTAAKPTFHSLVLETKDEVLLAVIPVLQVKAENGIVKLNEELRQKVVDIRSSGICNCTEHLTYLVPLVYLGVSFVIEKSIRNWAARQCAELEPFGCAVTRHC